MSRDVQKAEKAARLLISAFGRSVREVGLSRTPERFAHFLTEEFGQVVENEEIERAIIEEPYDILIMEREVPFMSLCEHHLLPFFGVAHIGYIPHGRILGLSKMARVVQMFSGTLSIQERLTEDVAQFLFERLVPLGVMVVVEATHLCMAARGVKVGGVITTTSCVKGVFNTNPAARQEMQLLLLRK